MLNNNMSFREMVSKYNVTNLLFLNTKVWESGIEKKKQN